MRLKLRFMDNIRIRLSRGSNRSAGSFGDDHSGQSLSVEAIVLNDKEK